MRTIAIINLKGGVGKTTTTVNVAAVLAKDYKQRVLVVDADSQCNATEFFATGEAQDCSTLADLLRETRDVLNGCAEDYINPTSFPGIDMISADDSLMDLDLTKVETASVEATVLRDLLSVLEGQDRYDFCFIDCPPAFNAASAAALIAADAVIIPIKLDAFSLRGMTNMMQQIANMRQINPELTLAGLLPTMWYNAPNIVEAEQILKDSGLPVLDHIRRTDKVDDMTFAQEPLLISSPRSSAGVDYRRFGRHLMKGGAVNG